MRPNGPCPACEGTGWIWVEPPEPGEAHDPGVGEYCSCVDGLQRRMCDVRVVDRILAELVDDALVNVPRPAAVRPERLHQRLKRKVV